MKRLLLIVLLGSAILEASAQSVLYFIENGGIERSRLDGSQRQVVVSGNVINAQGIAIDVSNNRLYWTDWVNDKIQTSGLDGQQVTDLVTTGLQLPEGIALDTVNGKMYWVDSGLKKVQRANLDGSLVETLVSYTTSVSLDGIALDVADGHMYWTDWGAGAAVGRVRRANLDGTGVSDLYTKPNGILKGIALDIAQNKMYWTDCGGFSTIERANLDGSGAEILVDNGLTTPNSLVLDLSAGKMYWTDLGIKRLRRANLDGTLVEDVISQNLSAPEGVSLTQCEEDGTGCFTVLPTSLDPGIGQDIEIVVNPGRRHISLKGLRVGDEIRLYNLRGQVLDRKMTSRADMDIFLAEKKPGGLYLLQVVRAGVPIRIEKILNL